MTVLAAIVAVANAATEIFRFLQTPQGEKFLADAAENHEKFEKKLEQIGDWFERLVKDQL